MEGTSLSPPRHPEAVHKNTSKCRVKMSPKKKNQQQPPSVVPAKVAKLEELVLYNSKLRFCPEQLQNLNYLFHRRLQRKPEAAFGM